VAESSEVLGEKYNAKHLLMIDGIATMLIGLFGGTAQTTAHAGFPAYKKMNARAGFLILNTLIVGIGAWFGLINFILAFIPDIALSPVLLFIGIEIALQVFLISEKKYLPAVIFGLFPSIARMVQIKLSSDPKLVDLNSLNNALNVITNGKMSDIAAIVTLGNGFIVTGTLWIALLYYLIERKIIPAVATCLFLALATIFGAIHSVHLDGSMYWIGDLAPQLRIIPIEIASGYLGFAVIAVIFYFLNKGKSANLH
jgi:AGZA family xanthine/uracil permease-like MFS transporter